MAAFLLDLDNNFNELSESVKGFSKGLKQLDSSFDKLAKSGDLANKSIDGVNKALQRFAASGKLLGSVVTGLFAVAEASEKLKALAVIGDAAYQSWKKFKGVEETLSLSTIITGTSELADNFKLIEQVADNAFNRIAIASKAVFDTKEFITWSSGAVSAYANVEQAAYRLATITSSANERSINKIGDMIKSTRQLQAATNDALGSVELLNTQYDIASAGFTSNKDNINVGKASVNLAQAGFGDVGGSTNAIVRTLRALGDSSSEAEKRAAQLFETTRVGLLTLNQLTPEVGTLAVSSKNLGIEFAEVSAALAGLTTQGISASEGATRLQAFFSEVVEGSQKANQFLASFRDEAGKPIQLNATALREKGIRGIIADLKKATGGNQAVLQQLFGRQESIEAVQLLSNLGTDKLAQYTKGISEASGERLDEEAKNRNKTVSGAFQQAANTAQKQVENFGQGLAPSVIDRVAETNEVVSTFLTTSAEGIGKLAGSLSGFSIKIKALGGFITTAFSTVAPFAFFAAMTKGFSLLSAKFSKLQQEGETPWQTIERLANDFISTTEEKFIRFLKKIRDELNKVKEEIKTGILEASNEATQLSLFDIPVNKEDSQLSLFEQPPTTEVTQPSLFELPPPPVQNRPDIEDATKQIETEKVVQLSLLDPKDKFTKAKVETVTALYEAKRTVTESANKIKTSLIEASKQTQKILDKTSATVKDNLQKGAQEVRKAIGEENIAKFKQSFSSLGKNIKDSLVTISSNLLKGDITRSFAGRVAGVGEFLTQDKVPNFSNLSKGIGSVGSKVGGVLNTGLKAASPLIATMGKYMLSLGLAGGVAGVGLAAVAGWSNTLFSSLNKKSIPALQEMREALLDIKNVKGLDEVLRNLDPVAGSIKGASYEMAVLNEAVYRGQKLWNDLTGATTNYFSNILPELNKAQELIETSLNKNLEDNKAGKFGAETSAGKTAEDKVAKGITLTQDDINALQQETDDRKRKAEALVDIQRRKIKEGEGKLSVEELENEKQKLKELELQTKEMKNQLDLQLKQIKLQEAVKRFKSIDTSIPLQLQISDQNEQAIRTQINGIADKFKQGFAGTLSDPAAFDKLNTEVENAIGAIETQIEIDPTSAAQLTEELRKTIPDFDKLLYSNPQLRQKAAVLNQRITEASIKNIQTQEVAEGAVYGQAQTLGSQSTLVASAKYESQTRSINSQVKALNEELQRPETTLARQKEILAQIEQLEAQRLQINTENRITQELTGRKQTLSLSEQLLDVEKARVNLFNQESKFGSLAITAAEARVQAAQQELAVKKEQIAISNKEELIKKESIVNALNQKAERDKKEQQRVTGGKSEEELRQFAQDKTQQEKEKANKEAEAVKQDTQRKVDELKKTPIKFDTKEIEQLKKAGLENIVDESGNLKSDIDIEKLNKTINEKASGVGSSSEFIRNVSSVSGISGEILGGFLAANRDSQAENLRNASKLLTDKVLDRKFETNKIQKEGESEVKAIEEQLKANTERAVRLADKQIEQAKQLKDKTTESSNVVGGEVPEPVSVDESKNVKGSALDDLKFTQVLTDIRERFGTLNEQIAISEAQIAKEFAGREKLIKRGELLGETLAQIAQNGSIFGNSVAGAALSLSALKLANKQGRLDKEADEEIAKINNKVQTLANNAIAAEQAAAKAAEAGVNSDIQKQLNEQAKKARELANSAEQEAKGDIEFVKQKTAVDKIAAGLEQSEARIALEFKARERLAERTERLAESFSMLANTALLTNSLAATALQRIQIETKNASGSIATQADKQIAQVNERIKTLENLAKQGGAIGAEAQKQLPSAKAEAKQEIQSIKVNAALAQIAANMELSAAKIKEEFSLRTRLIEISNSLGSAFNSLASTASTLFSNSSLGAILSRFAVEISNSSGKAKKEFDEQNRIIAERNKSLREAVTKAKQAGADDKTVKQLQEAADREAAQAPVEKAYLRQKLVLDTLNERLSIMAAKVNEVTDVLSKNASLSKDRIDFEQRQKDLVGESNRAGRSLQGALIGAFAKNNPFAELLQKRLDFKQASEDSDLQKSRNTTEAKKEILDLTLQKQQLVLEQQSYENALTQTQLLSDIVSLQQGGTAKFSTTADVQNRLNALPALIENSRQAAQERLNFVQQKLDFIPKELEQKNRNVDREKQAKQLGIVSSNGILDPSLLPEIKQVLSGSTQSLSQFTPGKIDPGSLRDSSFQADLARLNALSSSLNPLGRTTLQQQAQQTANKYQDTRQQIIPAPTIQAPISINLNITGADANNFNKNLEQNMKQYVSAQVQQAMSQLGKQLVAASRKV